MARLKRPICPICRKRKMAPVYLGVGYAPPKFRCSRCIIIMERDVAQELNRLHRQARESLSP